MSSLCCHFNWENAGSGRTGNGGVGTSSRLETANLNSRQSVFIHKEHQYRLDILILVQFLFFCVEYVGDNGREEEGN